MHHGYLNSLFPPFSDWYDLAWGAECPARLGLQCSTLQVHLPTYTSLNLRNWTLGGTYLLHMKPGFLIWPLFQQRPIWNSFFQIFLRNWITKCFLGSPYTQNNSIHPESRPRLLPWWWKTAVRLLKSLEASILIYLKGILIAEELERLL